MSSSRKGVLAALTAYVLWGLFPLYWPLLEPAGAVEILAHRMTWSLIVVLVLLTVMRKWASIRAVVRRPRTVALLAVAAVLISVNWGLYIWAVNNGHVVESSLGYFINPLLSIGLAVVVLGERLRRLQWWAIGFAALAVVVLTIDYGRLPWIALTLAMSFALYGLVKKVCGVGAVESLTIETSLLFLPAAGFLIYLQVNGTGTFGHVSAGKDLLLAGSGVVTAIPLVLFAAAAGRIPLATIGLMQYLTPVMQFLVGVLIRHEPMPLPRLFGFGLIWVALALMGAESLRHWQRQPRLVAEVA